MSSLSDVYYAAVLARDHRFDGKFFLGVKTTGIYCRPICPARPKQENVEFFESSVLAEKAGYRPCLRCRPEAAPLSPAWYGKSALVQRALRKIIDMGLEHESAEEFAAHFGVTARHLRRLFVEELGKTPKQFYQEQQLNLARKMMVETNIPITEIAYAAGFGSLRRFQDAFKKRFSQPPTKIKAAKASKQANDATTTLRLSYRPPFQWEALLAYLKRHEIQGIEEISATTYLRYYPTKMGVHQLKVENNAKQSALVVTLDHFDKETLYKMIQNARRLFDLDADPLLISNAFEKSMELRQLEKQHPGMRAPGAWDAFETAVCIVLGQLVSTKQAQALIAALVLQHGDAHSFEGKTVFAFPTPQKLACADLTNIPTTQKRRETIALLSQAIVSGMLQLNPHQDVQTVKKKLLAIPGIGPWTAEYIAMRCLGDPDAFPASDLILKRAAVAQPHLNLHEVRPWRAYAAYLLWNHSTQNQGIST